MPGEASETPQACLERLEAEYFLKTGRRYERFNYNLHFNYTYNVHSEGAFRISTHSTEGVSPTRDMTHELMMSHLKEIGKDIVAANDRSEVTDQCEMHGHYSYKLRRVQGSTPGQCGTCEVYNEIATAELAEVE